MAREDRFQTNTLTGLSVIKQDSVVDNAKHTLDIKEEKWNE